MHDSQFTMPWFTSSWLIVCVFVISLLIFHFLLVRYFPLSSISWKKVDYVWLTMGFIGIVGGISGNRVTVADNLLLYAKSRSDVQLDAVFDRAKYGSSDVICDRTFTPSEFSPPQDVLVKMKKEFDDQCIWFKTVTETLKTLKLDGTKKIDLAQLKDRHPPGGIDWVYSEFIQNVGRYNDSVEDLDSLKKEKSQSEIEAVFRYLGPLFIAVALALRITKVSGEILIERKKAL